MAHCIMFYHAAQAPLTSGTLGCDGLVHQTLSQRRSPNCYAVLSGSSTLCTHGTLLKLWRHTCDLLGRPACVCELPVHNILFHRIGGDVKLTAFTSNLCCRCPQCSTHRILYVLSCLFLYLFAFVFFLLFLFFFFFYRSSIYFCLWLQCAAFLLAFLPLWRSLALERW